MAIPRIKHDTAVLLVVDLQEKLLPVIDQHERVTERAGLLIEGFARLDLPIMVTEQYPDGLGPTVESIRAKLPADQQIDAKLKFSAAIEPIRKRLETLGRTVVVLCGVETHVCVLQTALDLAAAGYVVAVATDAIGSRKPHDHQTALHRLTQAGVLQTTAESALLEIIFEAGTESFKSILPLIK